MKTPSFISIMYVCIAVLLLLLLPIGQALAADIMVDADCSLQNAILSANGEEMVAPLADCEAGDADDGNAQVDDNGVEIPAGLDTITIDVAGTSERTITLDSTLTVSSEIMIEGAGVTINGGGKQIFTVTDGALTLNDLILSHAFSLTNGGAIAVTNAALTLNNSVINHSGARGLGGGIYALDSDLTLINSAVSINATDVSAEDFAPDEAESQAVDDESQVSQTGDDAEGDDASQEEQGDEAAPTPELDIDIEPEPEEELPAVEGTAGGGIYFDGEANRLVIDRSGVGSNESPTSGGGIYIASGSAAISNSTISGNRVAGEAGGIYNAGSSVLTHVTVVGNSAADTGGIVDTAMLLLYNSILADNTGGDCSGTLNATIGNLIHDLTCGHDGLSDDPMLLLLGGLPAYYLPQEGSPALDAASPDYCLLTDQREIDRVAETCDIGAAEHQPGVFKFQIQSALAALATPDPGGSTTTEVTAPQPTPVPSTCLSLPSHISVSAFSGTDCKVLDEGGVGNRALIDYGLYYAVDIFGNVSGAIKTCFQYHDGAIILLDAANSPRNIVPLRTWNESGRICADVDRAGTAVLMPLDFFTSGQIADPIWDLNGCTVTTTDILNLRSEPNGASSIVANVLNGVELTADKKATHYYRVNYYNIIGWLSSSYLSMSGNCQ